MRIFSLVGLVLALLFLDGCSGSHRSPESVELAPFMSRLQTFSQKLGYAIEARNTELANFYLHEIHETAEDIEKQVPEHDGHHVAALCKAVLGPAISQCEQVMSNGTWNDRWNGYAAIIASCNACHCATAHPFIRILPAKGVPSFNQDFKVQPAAAPK